jgi:hypothetical protein
MSLSPAEAQSALKDIEKTENRSAASQHHRHSAPYLILWGVMWAIGYTVTASAPQISWTWAPLIAIGVIGSILLSRRQSNGQSENFGWRYFASFAAIAIFIYALIAVMGPITYNQMSALIPLVIGIYYAFIGLWTRGWRMLPLGLALIALTTIGYFMLPEYFLYWMAGVGGGGLIVGGLWLRSA